MKHGKGRYEWPDGSYFDGEWLENNINGFGEYKWTDDRGYIGTSTYITKKIY